MLALVAVRFEVFTIPVTQPEIVSAFTLSAITFVASTVVNVPTAPTTSPVDLISSVVIESAFTQVAFTFVAATVGAETDCALTTLPFKVVLQRVSIVAFTAVKHVAFVLLDFTVVESTIDDFTQFVLTTSD